jgi:hypothetical protein
MLARMRKAQWASSPHMAVAALDPSPHRCSLGHDSLDHRLYHLAVIFHSRSRYHSVTKVHQVWNLILYWSTKTCHLAPGSRQAPLQGEDENDVAAHMATVLVLFVFVLMLKRSF